MIRSTHPKSQRGLTVGVILTLVGLDVLSSAIHAPDLSRGNCVGHSDVFDPLPKSHPDHDDREAEALALCHSCEVLYACRCWLDSLPLHELPSGVCGGRIEKHRRKAG
jgi:Transcription factor WhiB